MIKGEKKKEYLSVEEILKRTSGGYDIFRTYLGTVSRLMKRPWAKDKHHSWGVFPKNGIWFYKDQATEEAGTAIKFVEKFFNLSHAQAKDKICWDFGLGGGQEINSSPVQIVWEKPEVEEKEYCHISFDTQHFKKHHHKFWNAAEVPEDHLRKLNYFAVKTLAINRTFVPIGSNEVVMAYYAPEEDSVKIYFPERPDMKFRNNVPGDYLWNFTGIAACKKLLVQKSCKDLAVTTMITGNCTSTQNESAGLFNENMKARIATVSKHPIIWYGSDPDGVAKCQKITKEDKTYGYVNTPKNLLPDINDTYGYACKFKLKGLEQFMKLKKLI
jgi:hypothetical protein